MPSITLPAYAPPSAEGLPFPVGTSPFRQKGNGYLGDVPYLDSVVRGGFEAAVQSVGDRAIHAFFRQSFRTSDWYDAYPGAVLEVAAARLRGLPFELHRRETGAWHARHAARGLYGTLLRFVSNESIATWAPRIASIYFEFGKTESRAVGAREVLAVRRGIPDELLQWMTFASVSFVETTLRLGGARDPVVVIGEVSADGTAHGRSLSQVEIRMSWR